MRVLFFLEPVIFRDDPTFLVAHFAWVDCVYRAVIDAQGDFALVANTEVCEKWREFKQDESVSLRCFSLDSYIVLSGFGHKRSEYAKALYGTGSTSNQLVEDLHVARKAFDPDLVVMTSQNAFARHAFLGVPILNVEQAPLPRLGHPFRTGFDPCGHQTGSILEVHAGNIKSLPLLVNERHEIQMLIRAIELQPLLVDSRASQAQAALEMIRKDGPVALLVTQPPDWVTYEGAYQEIELEGLLCSWAASLPPGWIGVPTYHPGFRLSANLERAIARSCPKLRFLPQELSQGLTEPMLSCADGMVTLSSTTAMMGLLLQKRVIVTGTSPFKAWCLSDPACIETATPLTSNEVTSTFAFLCHRFAYLHDELLGNPQITQNLMQQSISISDPAEWFMDISNWSIARARSLFSFAR